MRILKMKTYIITDKDIIDIKTLAILSDDIAIDDILENLNELPTPKKQLFDLKITDDFLEWLCEDRTEFKNFINDNGFTKPEQPYYVRKGDVFEYDDLRKLFLDSRNSAKKK